MAASPSSAKLAIALAAVAAILLPVSLYVRHRRESRTDIAPRPVEESRQQRDPWARPDEPLPPRYVPRPLPPRPSPPPPPTPTPPPDLIDPFASRQPPPRPDAGTCGATCTCEDGTVTHVTQIVNGRCVDDVETCKRACASHEGVKGSWDPSKGKRLGDTCSSAAQCAQKVCNHGLCSRTCSTFFGDCPAGWYCESRSGGDDGECRKR